MKTCRLCLASQPTTEYYRASGNADGLSSTCRTCQLARHRAGRAALRARTDEEIEAAAAAAGSKQCPSCKLVKVAATGFPRDAGKPSGRLAICKPCNAEKVAIDRAAHPEKYVRRRKADYGNNRARSRAHKIKQLFGLTPERYAAMREAQNDLCMICGRPETRVQEGRLRSLHIDHDHATGAVRDLLCGSCNVGIGLYGDDPDRLRAAADYIERHRALTPE